MKNYLLILVGAASISSCNSGNTSSDNSMEWLDNAIELSAVQLQEASERYDSTMLFPRSLKTDYSLEQLTAQMEIPVDSFKPEIELLKHPTAEEYRQPYLVGYADWTSGFFPGSLWYAYELTGDETLKEAAVRYTNRLVKVADMTDTHDLGFMVNCSYGNAYRLAPNDTIRELVVKTARNLAGRYDQSIGCIRSWDFGPWNYPVIIDNMMNLDLLFNAAKLTGDSTFAEIARRHADTTMSNHFRDDFSCYHVVSYNDDGSRQRRQTFQGKADESSWSRGQGWALYGYTETYRNTGDKRYLRHAEKVADMIIARNNTEDGIPYWDLDAPESDSTPRDASAAAVIASGMIELSEISEEGEKYLEYAEKLLKALASPEYLAERGSNGGFILRHSTGSLPHGSEIDTPLNYADYYFLEALVRYKRVKAGKRAVEPMF
ncbi:MAG: glycoside hydrolase family 88 protein [Muribaculaceae bacterium]|nr:glycoside hydrolase family 88 protein [Muribaculaceae bacterium]